MTQLETNLQKILIDKNINLLPENLKTGITCLGVTGTLEEGIDTSDATATAEDIVKGKTAYINGEKIEGTVSEIPSSNNTGYGIGWFTDILKDTGSNIRFTVPRVSETEDALVRKRSISYL